jgi:hypothetical protein
MLSTDLAISSCVQSTNISSILMFMLEEGNVESITFKNDSLISSELLIIPVRKEIWLLLWIQHYN